MSLELTWDRCQLSFSFSTGERCSRQYGRDLFCNALCGWDYRRQKWIVTRRPSLYSSQVTWEKPGSKAEWSGNGWDKSTWADTGKSGLIATRWNSSLSAVCVSLYRQSSRQDESGAIRAYVPALTASIIPVGCCSLSTAWSSWSRLPQILSFPLVPQPFFLGLQGLGQLHPPTMSFWIPLLLFNTMIISPEVWLCSHIV